MRRLALILVLLLPSLVSAKVLDEARHGSPEEIQAMQIQAEGLTVNNISLRQAPAMFKQGLFNLDVTLSVRNLAEEKRFLTIMLVGFEDPSRPPLWSISAAPAFFTVAAGATAPVHGSVYVPDGTLARTKKIWIRVVGWVP